MDNEMKSNLLFVNVRKATRLLYEFQKRMQSTMFYIKSELKLSPAARIEVNKLYSKAPQLSKGYGETQLWNENWAWDYIYTQALEYYLGEKSVGDYDIGISGIQVADDGYFVAKSLSMSADRLNTDTYADVNRSESWLLFVVEVKLKTQEWAKRWSRDTMEGNLNKWMVKTASLISDTTKSGSYFIVKKFALKDIISEQSVLKALQTLNENIKEITGVSILD